MTLDEIVTCIRRDHYPKPGAAIDAIRELEARIGYPIPSDMKEFYLHFDGVSLFRELRDAPPMQIMTLAEIARPHALPYAEVEDVYDTASIFAFCDCDDGNYAAIDLAVCVAGQSPIIDVFHEAFPGKEYCPVICHGFLTFIGEALQGGGSGYFWGRTQSDE